MTKTTDTKNITKTIKIKKGDTDMTDTKNNNTKKTDLEITDAELAGITSLDDINKSLDLLDLKEVTSLDESIKVINTYKSLIGLMRYMNGGRKSQVLRLLKENPLSIKEIAMRLKIENKNVSSILNGLKSDGYKFGTNSEGRKYIEK